MEIADINLLNQEQDRQILVMFEAKGLQVISDSFAKF